MRKGWPVVKQVGELLCRSTKQNSSISLFIFATQTDHGQTMGRQWADEGFYIEFKQGAESGLPSKFSAEGVQFG